MWGWGGGMLLICAIDFPIASAPHLINENMLLAGNETWSFRRLHFLKSAFTQEKKKVFDRFYNMWGAENANS